MSKLLYMVLNKTCPRVGSYVVYLYTSEGDGPDFE